MLPSLTLHSAVNVAVMATLIAMMAFRLLSWPFSTASFTVSARSLMVGMVRDILGDSGTPIAASPRSPRRERPPGALSDPRQARVGGHGRRLQGRAPSAGPSGRHQV